MLESSFMVTKNPLVALHVTGAGLPTLFPGFSFVAPLPWPGTRRGLPPGCHVPALPGGSLDTVPHAIRAVAWPFSGRLLCPSTQLSSPPPVPSPEPPRPNPELCAGRYGFSRGCSHIFLPGRPWLWPSLGSGDLSRSAWGICGVPRSVLGVGGGSLCEHRARTSAGARETGDVPASERLRSCVRKHLESREGHRGQSADPEGAGQLSEESLLVVASQWASDSHRGRQLSSSDHVFSVWLMPLWQGRC